MSLSPEETIVRLSSQHPPGEATRVPATSPGQVHARPAATKGAADERTALAHVGLPVRHIR